MKKKNIILACLWTIFIQMILSAQSVPNGSYVPIDKNINSKWVESLFEKGERKVYKDKELNHIAMPCGGIGSGQVEITGEGKISFTESVYNQIQKANAGYGFSNGYQYLHPQKPKSKVENNFSLILKAPDREAQVYELTGKDFDDIQFVGEYPIAQLEYRRKKNKLPIKISSEIFSPFVPLDLRSSANPVTVIKYTVTNTGNQRVNTSIVGWLKNIEFPEKLKVKYVNTGIKSDGITGASFEMQPIESTNEIMKHPQLGGFSLSVLDENASYSLESISAEEYIKKLVSGEKINEEIALTSQEPVGGSVSSNFSLAPNETKSITFTITWFFPNYIETANDGYIKEGDESFGLVGRMYDNWYSNSTDVAKYVSVNFNKLYRETKLFRNTYFDNTLPYWLANRITMPVSTLAAGNINIWKNGRMYAYEGVGFCVGTCGHVYNFVTAISKLFPQLERSVRLYQDFNYNGALGPSGRINFRGFAGNNSSAGHSYASDAQSGYVLKAYREHLMSVDNSFLDEVWDEVKMAMGYNIFKDGAEVGIKPNGVLEGKQTFWDPMWYGPNPYNNSLYLAALRASEEMAKIKGELDLAKRYHDLFEKGQAYMNKEMWNGEYYVHLYPTGFTGNVGSWNGFRDPKEIDNHAKGYIEGFNKGEPNYQVGGGCDANQIFGQNWAHQLGLGYILPKENCYSSAQSIFKYCWTPDISSVYDFWKPVNRTLAASGESGMVNAGWPYKEKRDFENTHDKNDVWTGLEYEASCDMINEGLIKEALISIRSIDDRYDGVKRNPWNEIEGSDHYSRAMHSWNVLLSLSGYVYDGPAGIIGFDPQITPEDFKSFFTSAEGWGNITQKIEKSSQQEIIEIKWGQLRLNHLKFTVNKKLKLDKVKVTINGKRISSSQKKKNGKLIISFDDEQVIKKGQQLMVLIE